VIVLVVECATPSLRGRLTKWLLEIKAGVFVGTVSAAVRDRLWQTTTRDRHTGAVVLVHPARCEQGFRVRIHGVRDRTMIDLEGLHLVRTNPG
jgi:CRISPR-associated protein Cas2